MSQGGANDEAGKIFVGGINRETTEERLRSYFERYGEVGDCILMKDKETGRSRGFGFVTYTNPQCVAEVLKHRPHTIDEKVVDPKPCTPRHIQQQKKQTANQFAKGHKIFVGGISMETSEDDVKGYFERYGVVIEVIFVVNKSDTTRPHKGFGFVTFEDESSVDQACAKHFHMIKDKRVEAKKAESREKMDKQNDQQNPAFGNMNYGQQNAQGMQGNMANMNYAQGMTQPQGWMGNQMMGNYNYGSQNFPTAYPQSYGNQGYGYGYPQGYGSMQQPQQPMAGNMAGYGSMPPNPGMMSGPGMPQGNMPNNPQNNGNMRGQGDMGSYQQNPSNYGPTKSSDYMAGGSNMGMKNDYGGNMNQMGSGHGSGGYGPSSGKQQGGGGSGGYHPYRR